jgi:hypothetical protein
MWPERLEKAGWINVCFWHKADVLVVLRHVRFRG